MPAWASVNATTGAITSTSTPVIGHYTFSATVTDSETNTFTQTFSFEVFTRLSALAVTPPPSPQTTTQNYQLQVSGATSTVTWTTLSGTYPGTVTLSSSGLISGNVQVSYGDNPVTVRATDSGTGDTLDVSLKLWVFDHFKVTGATITGGYVQSAGVIAITEGVPLVYTFTGIRDTNTGADIPQTDVSANVTCSPTLPGILIARNGNVATATYTPPPGSSTSIGTFSLTPAIKDAQGHTYTPSPGDTLNFVIYPAQGTVQVQQSGTNVGDPGPVILNFDGATVTDTGSGARKISFSGGASASDVMRLGFPIYDQVEANDYPIPPAPPQPEATGSLWGSFSNGGLPILAGATTEDYVVPNYSGIITGYMIGNINNATDAGTITIDI